MMDAADAGSRMQCGGRGPDRHDACRGEDAVRAAEAGRRRPSTILPKPITGGKLRFTNVEQETPIGEFSAYYVHPGDPPEGIVQLRYTGSSANKSRTTIKSWTPLVDFIHGRYPADERTT